MIWIRISHFRRAKLIKNIEQAKKVQARRAAAKKRGYAKAVRRCLKREASDYQKVKQSLPVVW